MFIEWLCKWLCDRDKDIPAPDIVGDINYFEIYNILRAEFGEDVVILISDMNYKLATKESFERFLEADGTDKYVYSSDYFDCDNYAEVLAGRTAIPKWGMVPIGTLWLTEPAHAVNIFVDENRIAWICEPQNDKLFRMKKDWIPNIVWI